MNFCVVFSPICFCFGRWRSVFGITWEVPARSFHWVWFVFVLFVASVILILTVSFVLFIVIVDSLFHLVISTCLFPSGPLAFHRVGPSPGSKLGILLCALKTNFHWSGNIFWRLRAIWQDQGLLEPGQGDNTLGPPFLETWTFLHFLELGTWSLELRTQSVKQFQRTATSKK